MINCIHMGQWIYTGALLPHTPTCHVGQVYVLFPASPAMFLSIDLDSIILQFWNKDLLSTLLGLLSQFAV